MKELMCLRCNTDMELIKREKLQLGQTGWFLRDLPNLLAGALEVDIYSCPECGKLEFFNTDNTFAEIEVYEDDEVPQVKCPKCGKEHDFDYPRCPVCKYKY